MSLEATLERQGWWRPPCSGSTPVTAGERLTGAMVAGVFCIVVAGLWRLDPPHSFVVWPAAVCLLVMALATRTRLDTPLGSAAPTQLAFVPLLFAMPVVLVPPAVVLALLIARLPDVLRGTCKPSRLLLTVNVSWFAIGPVAVIVIAPTTTGEAGAWLLLVALAARFIVDFVVSGLRFGIVGSAGPARATSRHVGIPPSRNVSEEVCCLRIVARSGDLVPGRPCECRW